MDTEPKQRAQDRARIEEEAAAWVVSRAGGVDASLDRAIDEWAARSPHHAVALARAEAAWDAAERLRAAPPPLEPEAVAGPAGRIEAWFTGGRVAAALTALSVAAMLATVTVEKLTSVDRYSTGIGQRRTVVLADGSRIHLNTATTIEMGTQAGERDVRVLEGEALFEVTPGQRRPFVVEAKGSAIRATSTRFNLRLRPDLVELTVTDGAVTVRDGPGAGERVAAGNSAAIRNGLVARMALGDAVLRQRTDWTRGVVDLTGASLGEAVEEFNRYRLHPVVIADPRLAALGVAGRYPTSRSDLFVARLEQRLAVRAVATRDGSILLVGREGATRG